MIQHYAEKISLAMTGVSLIMIASVIIVYASTCYVVMKNRAATASELFIVAVVIGKAADLFDGGYWGIPWTLKYLEMPMQTFFFEKGVYPNIFFRQLLSTISSYLHIKAFFLHVKDDSSHNSILAFSLVTGFCIYMLL